MTFFKNCTFVFDRISFFLSGLAEPSVDSQAGFFKSHHGWRIVETRGGAFPLVAIQFKVKR